MPVASLEIVEQAIDLLPQRFERAGFGVRLGLRLLCGPYRHFGCNFGHDQSPSSMRL
jgi:hypothetical protein